MRIRKTTPDDPNRCENCFSFVQHYRKCKLSENPDGYKPCEFGECIYDRTRQTAYTKTCDMFHDREQCLDSIRKRFGV